MRRVFRRGMYFKDFGGKCKTIEEMALRMTLSNFFEDNRTSEEEVKIYVEKYKRYLEMYKDEKF